jgi:hypothetical protein
MEKNKQNAFMFYLSWSKQIEMLTAEETKSFIQNLIRYHSDEELIFSSKLEEMLFTSIEISLETNKSKYQVKVETNRENGKKGGRPKTQNNPKKPNGYSENPKNPNKNKESSIKNQISNTNNQITNNNNQITSNNNQEPNIDNQEKNILEYTGGNLDEDIVFSMESSNFVPELTIEERLEKLLLQVEIDFPMYPKQTILNSFQYGTSDMDEIEEETGVTFDIKLLGEIQGLVHQLKNQII